MTTRLSTARELMSKVSVTLREDMTVAEAARLLTRGDQSGAPVVDESGRLVGVLSQSDVLHAAFPHHVDARLSGVHSFGSSSLEGLVASDAGDTLRHLKVSDVMTDEVISASPEEAASSLAAKMRGAAIHRIIIVETDKVVGVVTSMDLLRVLEQMG